MDKYKLIAFDMDGTLLNSEKKITNPVLSAIAEASGKGRQVVLASGRSLGELRVYKDILRYVRYWVAESGAVVYDAYNNRILYRKTFSTEVQDALVAVAEWNDTDTMFLSMSEGEIYIDSRGMENMSHYNMAAYESLFEECGRIIGDFPSFMMRNNDGFEKINIISDSSETREIVLKRLEEQKVPATFVKAEISNLECSPTGISKATGLKELCSYLNISSDQVIAVGDADNDLEMLKSVGFPIAMGNGNKHVKSVAKAVVSDNNHDGTAQAIHEYLLKTC